MTARTRLPLAAMAATLALTAACDSQVEPVPNTLPTPAGSGGTVVATPAEDPRWTGLAAKCPKLTGAAAASVNATGEGRPTADHRVDGGLTTVDCIWGSTDGQGVAVTLRMSIYPVQGAADAAWQVLAAGQTDDLPGVGDEAFSATEPRAAVVRARSANAVATVRVVVPGADATPDRLTQLRTTAGEITADVLDDLR